MAARLDCDRVKDQFELHSFFTGRLEVSVKGKDDCHHQERGRQTGRRSRDRN